MVCDITARGSEALQMIAAARQRPYDIVIIDMQMPGMDGLEVAQVVRADPANDRIKLVLMTSQAQDGHAARSVQAGIAGSVRKPLKQSQLYECLRTVMGAPSTTVPRAGQHAPGIVRAHGMREAQGLRCPRVLLAEDNQTNQTAAVRMLEMLGYQVDVAITGIEAVAACRDVDYEVVLMDNQMPVMDGLKAAREIRRIEVARGKAAVPIIALTANAMPGDREKCVAAGMNDYLSKPFKIAQLSEMLQSWVQSPRSHAPSSHSVLAADAQSGIDSSIFDDFRELGEDDGGNQFVVTLIAEYLVEAAARIAALMAASSSGDALALGRTAHSLKGSSSAVGARKLAALCDECETLVRDAALAGTPDLVIAIDHEFARVTDALRIISAGSRAPTEHR
jgi:CheY-like chemotaxis protein/HPt (histidine-containing phosphotransfer) domain-containing protein